MSDNNLTTQNSALKNGEKKKSTPETGPDILSNTEKNKSEIEVENKLALDEDLIKIEKSPYDELFEDAPPKNDFSEEKLVKTNISDEITPNNESCTENNEVSDNLYALPDETVSSSEKEELIKNLHSKIPSIIQHNNADIDTEVNSKPKVDKPTPQKLNTDLPKIDKTYKPEDKTEIFQIPEKNNSGPVPVEKKVYLKNNTLQFGKSTIIRAGEEIIYLGRKYYIRKKHKNVKKQYKLGIIVIALLLVSILSFSAIFSGHNTGKLVGLLINLETNSIVSEAQITIDELGLNFYTDENGLFFISQIDAGDWSLSASKPQYRTAALGFSISKGETQVVTLIMEPSVPSLRDSKNNANNSGIDKPVKKKTYGKLAVIANVANARIIIDNKVMGAGNKTFSKLYPGKHKLVVTKEGYKEHSETIVVKANQTTSAHITMEEIAVAYNPTEIGYEQYLKKADDYASQNNWREALGNYTLALAKKEDADIYFKRSNAYQELNQNDQAIADLFKAAQLFSNHGTITRTLESFNQILKLSPRNSRALRERGFALLRKGEFEKAIIDLKQAVKIDSKSFANQIALGEALYIVGEYKESLKYLKKARKIDNSNARVYALTALSSLAKGSEKDARKYYKGFDLRATDLDRAEFDSDPDWQRLAHLVAEAE